MRNSLCPVLFGTTLGLLMVGAWEVRAEMIWLDFDSPTTGSELLVSPLMVPQGTIIARNVTSFSTVMGTGNALQYRDANGGFATLDFDFDVRRITFIYTGEFFGVFNAIVRNAQGSIVDHFFNPDTSSQTIWGPITLSGIGIRTLEFADAPDGALLAAIDNVEIALVPEPISARLFVFGLAGLVAIGRRRAKRASALPHSMLVSYG